MKHIFQFMFVLFVLSISLNAQITSAASGNWSAPATWTGGVVPTASDDVTIGHTVSIDIPNAECKNLTINSNLYFATTTGNGITIYGNTVVNAGKRFRMASATPASGQAFQTIDFKGDLTIASTGVFDMRQTSSAIGVVGKVIFSGSANSTINMALTTYTSASEEFNSVEINKTGGAKVILTSGNVFLNNNSTNMPDTLILTSGVFETGANHLVLLRTGSAGIVGASSSSYINGILGRGVSNGGGQTEISYPVGDASTYRPISVHFDGPANATGHYVWAKVISGNANTGSSTLNGGLTKVSDARYYQIGYLQNAGTSATMNVDRVSLSYRSDDGVNAGNKQLRVAYSLDAAATWDTLGSVEEYTTDLTSPPTMIVPDTLLTAWTINTGTSIYTALGTLNSVSNPLPVELSAFSVTAKNKTVELLWSTVSEINNAGFDVEKNVAGEWRKLGFVAGAGTSNAPKEYSFTDNSVTPGSTAYRLKQIDRDGKFEYSKSIEVNVVSGPAALALNGNYPNPFNPVTNISFTVPSTGQTVVKVFDVLGKEIAIVFNGIADAGTAYAVPFNAATLPSGIYFSRLEFGGQRLVKKMLLVK
jgi:hypothetical protein